MKKFLSVGLMSLYLLAGIGTQAVAEEKGGRSPKIEIMDDAALKKITDLQQPQDAHQALLSLTGKWYYTFRYWAQPDSEPQISTGIMMNEMILADRYLASETSIVLNIDSQNIPYQGRGFIGYDAGKKEYTSIWADTLQPGIVAGSGKYDEKRDLIEQKGEFINPLLAVKQGYRMEIQFNGNQSHKRKIYVTGKSGKESLVAEIDCEKRL